MKRFWILLILLACPVITMGQPAPPAPAQGGNAPAAHNPPGAGNPIPPGGPTFHPIAPPPSTTIYGGGGGYGWGGGGQTAQGAALQGMSQVISAAGQYNLATSAAAINATQAESNQMRNDVQGVETFWQMRNIGAAERAKERGPAPTAEELARRARAGIPQGLTASQIDPVTGALYWPAALQDPGFQPQKTAVEECTAKWVKYGGLTYADQTKVRENIDTMFDGLKAQIQAIPPQDYVACRTFLQSLLYATTRTTL
jgi:hypothetical protein